MRQRTASVCALVFVIASALHAQPQRLQIARWEQGAPKLLYSAAKLKSAVEKAVSGGTVLGAVTILKSGNWYYLHGTGRSGGRQCALAIELERDDEGLTLAPMARNFQCISEDCPSCALRTAKDGRIVGCRCKGVPTSTCRLMSREELPSDLLRDLFPDDIPETAPKKHPAPPGKK